MTENALGDAFLPLPESARVNYAKWRETVDDQALTQLIGALFETLEVSTFFDVYAEKGDDMVILDDLGIDSLTLAEMLFYTEDLLKIRISNADAVNIRTLGNLKSYLAERSKELPAK
jgi:acyl carrier protein